MQLTNQDKPFLSSPQFRKRRPQQLTSLRDVPQTTSDLPLSSPQTYQKFSSISIPDLFPMQECSLFSTRSGGTKAQFSIGQVPVLIKDQGYIKRKKTVDTFLKLKDLELVLGAKSKQTHQINRNTSIGEVGVLHNKLKRELLQKEKFKKGKMYSNELWSTNFYNAIMDVSDLKKKSDLLSKTKFKNIEHRIEEVEDYYHKLTEKTIRENEQTLREVKESPSQSLRDINELAPIKFTSDSHRAKPPLKNATMAAFFKKNRGPSTDSPKSSMNHFAHIFDHRSYRKSQDFGDAQDVPSSPEKSSPKTMKVRTHRQRKLVRSMPEELQIMTNEDYSPETCFTGPSLIVSPQNQTSGRIKTGFITSTASIFSGERKGDKSLTSLMRSVSIKIGDDSPDSRSLMRNTSLETEDLAPKSGVRLKSKTPRASAKLDTLEKRMSNLLINKCVDFNNETQEMKKEFDDCRQNFDAFLRRKEISKVNERKAKKLSDALETQKKFFQNRKNK